MLLLAFVLGIVADQLLAVKIKEKLLLLHDKLFPPKII